MARILLLTFCCLVSSAASLEAGVISYDPFPREFPRRGRVYGAVYYEQDGVYAEHVYFRPSVGIQPNHTHFTIGGSSGNYEGDHDLFQMLVIESVDGSPFNFSSVDYAGTSDGQILVGTAEPTQPGRVFDIANFITQFTAFDVSSTGSRSEFETLLIDGFENVSRIYLTSTGDRGIIRGSFALDNITINAATVPEPASVALWAVGIAAAALTVRRQRRSGLSAAKSD